MNEIEEFIGFEIPVYNLPDKSVIEKEREESIKTLKSRPKVKEQRSKDINNNITKIYLNGGKKKKIRPGDIVGAICKIEGIRSEDIGIIDVQDSVSYVDILNGKGKRVIEELKNITIKGKIIKAEKAKK